MNNKVQKIKLRHIVFGFLVLGIVFLDIKYKYEHVFSTSRWIEYPRERVKMVDNLLQKHNLLGLSKEEIIGLLGNETEAAYFKESNNFVYYMGDERGLISIDSEWLVITLNDNIVTDVIIMRD